jgi:alpha-galactosidase
MPPFEIIRPPDHVHVVCQRESLALAPQTEERWAGGGVELDTIPGDGLLALHLRSTAPLMFLHLRWDERLPEGLRYLSDTWALAREPLEWRCLVPERDMPWYLLAYDGQHTHGVGVKTGASALCRWQVDPFGITLWLDVRNGAGSMRPGDRQLHLADVVVRPGKVWELPFQAARRFATLLDDDRLMPEQPLYGFSCARGAQTGGERLLEKARLLSDLAENTVNRPFLIIDHGWQAGMGTAGMHSDPSLGDMAALAAAIAKTGSRPGLWLRPLLAGVADDVTGALPSDRFASSAPGRVLDPTHPATQEIIERDVARAVAWGFALLRYDLTTSDLLGDWSPFPLHATQEGWRFSDHRLTTAEVLRNLYAQIREAAHGRVVLAASDTMGHLTAGQVHVQRISDSAGRERWLLPHIVAVNALAFRGFHHGALYAAEADPVALERWRPWELGEQWLRLLAASGTPCFVAPGDEPLDRPRQGALRSAFAQASRQLPLAEPLDWLATTSPGRWKLGNETASFDWYSAQYARLA